MLCSENLFVFWWTEHWIQIPTCDCQLKNIAWWNNRLLQDLLYVVLERNDCEALMRWHCSNDVLKQNWNNNVWINIIKKNEFESRCWRTKMSYSSSLVETIILWEFVTIFSVLIISWLLNENGILSYVQYSHVPLIYIGVLCCLPVGKKELYSITKIQV